MSDIDVTDWSREPSSARSAHSSVWSRSPSLDTGYPASSSSFTGASTLSSFGGGEDDAANALTLPLHPAVTVSFTKGTRHFRLRYTQIKVCKDSFGNLRCLELDDLTEGQGRFVHRFPNTKLPIPHVEKPYTADTQPPFVVSFLEDQAVMAVNTPFIAQPHYEFAVWEDCVNFQEAMFDQTVLLTAGVSEIWSKGRGEECISQNLRIIQGKAGVANLLFFANSQRKDAKRHVSIRLDQVEHVDQGKKPDRPVALKLTSSGGSSIDMRTLKIQFLDAGDKAKFCEIVSSAIGRGTA